MLRPEISLQHQICINPWLKIDPINSNLNNVCWKPRCPAVVAWALLKNETLCDLFLKIYVLDMRLGSYWALEDFVGWTYTLLVLLFCHLKNMWVVKWDCCSKHYLWHSEKISKTAKVKEGIPTKSLTVWWHNQEKNETTIRNTASALSKICFSCRVQFSTFWTHFCSLKSISL